MMEKFERQHDRKNELNNVYTEYGDIFEEI